MRSSGHEPRWSRRPQRAEPPPPDSPEEQRLVDRLTTAFETSDVDGLVSLLADDVRLSMPPFAFEYIGREAANRFYAIVVGARPGLRIVRTRANGQPALATYRPDPTADVFRATSLLVVTLAGREVAEITRFDSEVLRSSGCRGSSRAEPRDRGTGVRPTAALVDGRKARAVWSLPT